MKARAKIEQFLAMGWNERAAFYKGRYERRNCTYIRKYEFLNDYPEYIQGLEV